MKCLLSLWGITSGTLTRSAQGVCESASPVLQKGVCTRAVWGGYDHQGLSTSSFPGASCCAWEFQAQWAGSLDKNVCGEGQGSGNPSSWTALAPHSPNLPSLLCILNPSALMIIRSLNGSLKMLTSLNCLMEALMRLNSVTQNEHN